MCAYLFCCSGLGLQHWLVKNADFCSSAAGHPSSRRSSVVFKASSWFSPFSSFSSFSPFSSFSSFSSFCFFSYLGGWWGRGACHRRASSCGEETVIHSADFFDIQRSFGSSIAIPKLGQRSSHQRTQVRVERWLVDVVADAHRTSIFKVGCAECLKIAVAENL